MLIPKSVKIGAENIQVLWFPALTDAEGTPVWGIFDTHERVIKLDTDMYGNKGLILDTFFHEIIHVMNSVNRLKLDDDTIYRLGFMLAAFLSDNEIPTVHDG